MHSKNWLQTKMVINYMVHYQTLVTVMYQLGQMQRNEGAGGTQGFYMYDVRLMPEMLLTGTDLHGYLVLFLFYLMIFNGSDY